MRHLAQAPHESPTADGLIQRFQLAVWQEISPEWEYTNHPPLDASQATVVYERLTQLDYLAPKRYLFAPAAQELFVDWLTELERTIRSNAPPAALQAHLAKYRSPLPSLALLFESADAAASGVETQAVSLAHARQAANWTEYLRSHAERIYFVEITPQFQAAPFNGIKVMEG